MQRKVVLSGANQRPPSTAKNLPRERRKDDMSSPARALFLKKVSEEVGGHAFLKRVPEERTRKINVFLVASVSAAVHVALGVLLAPLFAIAFLAVKTPSHPVLFGEINGATLAALFPVLYGIVGFVVGAVASGLYNSLAKHMFPPEPQPVVEVEEESRGLEIVYSRSV